MMNTNKMDESEKNIPDDFWRKTFDEAAETPPIRVWDAIERQLDESNGPKIIPLWGLGLVSSRLVVWGTGIAAGLALLLVGWWGMNTLQPDQTVARVQPSDRAGNPALASSAPAHLSARKLPGQVQDATAFTGKPLETLVSPAPTTDRRLFTSRTENRSERRVLLTRAKFNGKINSTGLQPTTAGLRALSVTTLPHLPTPTTSQLAVTSFLSNPNPVVEGSTSNQVQPIAVAFEQLSGKPLRLRSPGPIQRIVWFRSSVSPMETEFTKEKRKTREMWASVSAMPGAFNPLVSIRSAPTSLMNTVVAKANTNQSTVTSRANFSVAYQAGAGVQLTERWSVESGLGYLAGHSTVEAPAQSAASFALIQGNAVNYSSGSSNLYVDALRNSSSMKPVSSSSQAYADKLTATTSYIAVNSYANQPQQTLTNDYQYVQVPIQVGYQLRPRKRLSLAVLGGLLTNVFVRNTVGSDVVVKAKDGVYKPVSLAATMGARFRYRPSGRWSASLAGLYQPALESGSQSDSQVQSHPTSTGMSFGIDYHF